MGEVSCTYARDRKSFHSETSYFDAEKELVPESVCIHAGVEVLAPREIVEGIAKNCAETVIVVGVGNE